MVQIWKDFRSGWWNAQVSTWFPGVRHFENSTPWIQLHLGLHDRAWNAMNGHSRKLAQLSMTIFSKFWSWDRYPILHRGTSHIGSCWHVFLGQAALGLSFREGKHRNGQICPSSFEDNVLLTHGSRPRYFLIIAIAATSAAVICQYLRIKKKSINFNTGS